MSLAATDLAIRRGIALLDADPVSRYIHSSHRHMEATRQVGRHEVYFHAPNKGGKTTWGAMLGVAFSRGLRLLDGVKLPRLRSPNIGLVLSLDYNQQKDSVQKAYLDAVGTHPHKAEWDGEILKSLRVKPDDSLSDDPREWSVIRFVSQENRRSGVGTRCDWCHADEPPREDIWREVRKAGVPGWPFPMFITATPLERAQWWWLRGDYPLSHEHRVSYPLLPDGRQAASGYFRTSCTIEDVMLVPGKRGGHLTQADVDALHAKYATDPDKVARLTGREIDTSGASPFRENYAELQRWLDACTDGELQEWKVSREKPTPEGKVLVTEYADVEVWEPCIPGHVYEIVLDSSLGIDDGKHDPCEATVMDMTTGNEVACYSGYIGGYGLGVLGAGLSKHYGDALVHPAVTGGYGGEVLTGLRVGGCRNIFVRSGRMAVGELERTEVGFTESAATRTEHVAAIREALVWSEAGHQFMRVRCRRQVGELLDLIMKDGKPVTDEGYHDEALVTIGRLATRLRPTAKAPVKREVPVRTVTPREAWRRANGLVPEQRPRTGRRQRPNAPAHRG